MLKDMKFVEHHVGLRQNPRDGVEIGPVHVGTHRANRAPLMRVEVLGEQGRGGGRCAILTQAHDLAPHHIRQHGPEALAFPALDLIKADVPRPAFPTGAIPLGQESLLGAPSFAPTDAVPHGGVAGRHRLAIQADLLAQPVRHPCLRVGKLDPLRAHPALATDHAALPINQRDRMQRPGQIVPRPLSRGAHPAGPAPTAAAYIAPYAAPLQLQPQATLHPVVLPFDAHHTEARQAQDPGTIPLRSHVSSLLGCTSRENNIGSSGAKWDRALPSRPPIWPSAKLRPAQGPRITSDRCTQIDEEPLFSGVHRATGHRAPLAGGSGAAGVCLDSVHRPFGADVLHRR